MAKPPALINALHTLIKDVDIIFSSSSMDGLCLPCLDKEGIKNVLFKNNDEKSEKHVHLKAPDF